jgi:hypothetical protein
MYHYGTQLAVIRELLDCKADANKLWFKVQYIQDTGFYIQEIHAILYLICYVYKAKLITFVWTKQ